MNSSSSASTKDPLADRVAALETKLDEMAKLQSILFFYPFPTLIASLNLQKAIHRATCLLK
jgi:hypothetical protein